MYSEPLDAVPLWLMLIGSIGILCLMMELGYFIGRWRHARIADEKEQPVGAMVASILGLMALLLGFTFSLAASRFEARRQTILQEANAIGTTYLRARLLPEPQRAEVIKLLREYVEVRIEAVPSGKLDEMVKRSEELHELLWRQTSEAAEQDPHSILTGVFIQSLNELIDLHAQRVLSGMRSRIPLMIWLTLYGLAMLSTTAVGYSAGISATRRSPAMLGLVISFSLVLWLIADLDRGQAGFLRISQQALMDVQDSMQPSSLPAESTP